MVVGHGMPRRFLGDDRGFSLLEILIALSTFFIVLFAVYTTFDTSQATYAAGEQRADIQQNARVAMEVIGADLRLAGYGFPTGAGNVITAANATSITFWGDVMGASTTICNPDVGTGITTFNVADVSGIQAGDTIYLINGGQSEQLTVQSVNITPDLPPPAVPCDTPDTITTTTGTAAAYPWGSQVGRPSSIQFSWAANTLSKDDGEGGGLQPLADNIQNFQLQYFDAADNLIAAPVPVLNLPNIRRMTISFTAQSPQGPWRQQNFNIVSDIRPRNL
ncbi:MAG: PilW family protein [Candidatus Methylomirabilales bacterium]